MNERMDGWMDGWMDACRSRLCMYVSIYLCIYLFVHVSVCMHGCLRAWMYVQMHAGMHVCAQQHVYSKGVQSLDGYTYTFTYMKYVYVYTLYLYIYIFIYMVTPPRSTPASSTRFHCLLLCIGPLLIYAENTVNADTIVLFAMSSACFLRRSAVGLSAEVLS